LVGDATVLHFIAGQMKMGAIPYRDGAPRRRDARANSWFEAPVERHREAQMDDAGL